MISAWFGRGSAITAMAFLAVACHDSPSGLKKTGGGTSTFSDSMYATAVVDRPPLGADVAGTWGGLTLLVGSDQSVHIFSADTWDNRLRYAACDTGCDQLGSWATVTVDSLTTLSLMPSISAVMTSGGVTVVGSTRGSASALRIATCDTGCTRAVNWQAASIFSGGIISNDGLGRSTPLAADAGGGLHLVFGNGANQNLEYAECATACLTEGNWQTVTVDTAAATWFAKQVAVDAGGRVHAVYQRADSLLTYATCASACTTAASWHTATIDPTKYAFGYGGGYNGVSIAFGTGGTVHVAYVARDSVKYARCDSLCGTGGVWSVSSLGRQSADAALAIDGSGILHLATNWGSVAVATCANACATPANWLTVKADSVVGGNYVTMGLDATGHERVASSSLYLQYTRIK